MQSKEIPREQWISFLDDFSKRHAGWVVTMEVLGSDLGDQEESAVLPLVGISADVKDGENRIEVMVGGRPDANLTHIIDGAKRVLLTQSEAEQHDAVEIESDDGTRTLLHFRYVPPEETERQLWGHRDRTGHEPHRHPGRPPRRAA
jgi:hypothetical protein